LAKRKTSVDVQMNLIGRKQVDVEFVHVYMSHCSN